MEEYNDVSRFDSCGDEIDGKNYGERAAASWNHTSSHADTTRGLINSTALVIAEYLENPKDYARHLI